ncbi:uncharacterized protein LOC127750521 [Frankliniella occidentalis]|uniref:Uncharacterized protein LOC127750521 n=1 Tax=Frankliniella occidentalis TaxID=133901 RepID=A0A9C6X3A2_FRAOC|nr:uncharacterized protein LOC127750521 [Frankliniella occidentalis]
MSSVRARKLLAAGLVAAGAQTTQNRSNDDAPAESPLPFNAPSPDPAFRALFTNNKRKTTNEQDLTRNVRRRLDLGSGPGNKCVASKAAAKPVEDTPSSTVAGPLREQNHGPTTAKADSRVSSSIAGKNNLPGIENVSVSTVQSRFHKKYDSPTNKSSSATTSRNTGNIYFLS